MTPTSSTAGVCFVLLSLLTVVESTRQSAYAKMADVAEHTAESAPARMALPWLLQNGLVSKQWINHD